MTAVGDRDRAAFEVVMASAGTGKTFALTNRLAGLLANGVPIDRVLAATFTRKAAGEIRERLLSRIARAAADEEAAKELSGHAGCDLDRAGWSRVLRTLARGIHRIRIGTLDSLAQSLAHSLSLELSLAWPWTQAKDHAADDLRREVVERVLAELPDDDSRALLVILAGAPASAREDLRLAGLLAQAGSRLDRIDADAWACLADEASEGPDREALLAAAERLGQLPAPLTQKKQPNSRFVTAAATIVEEVRSGGFLKLLGRSIVANCEEPEPTFYRAPVPQAWLDELRIIKRGVIRAELAALHERNLAAWTLIGSAMEIDRRVRAERRSYTLDDLWRALADADVETQQVAYRLDTHFDHVLLDEFQDTSIDQWRVLEPLIDEALAGGERDRSVFVVGDVKQALYGWRNAQAELLPYVARHWPQMRARSLSRTYRCAPAIIDAVNAVFGSLAENAVLAPHRAAAERFASRFETHESAVEGPSVVRLIDLDAVLDHGDDGDADADQGDRDEAIEHIADRVARVHRTRQDDEVAVLVRRQRPIPELVSALERRGVRAVADAASTLCDHPAVEAVLAALQLAAHPEDGPARFAVATGPLASTLGIAGVMDTAGAMRAGREIARRVFESGLVDAVEHLAAEAAEHANARGQARLGDLIGQAESYEQEPPEHASIDDFIRFVRAARVRPRGEGVVRVLTLHGAKGLQFDTVFVADLDGDLAKRTPTILAGGDDAGVSSDPTAPPRLVSLAGTAVLRQHSDVLASLEAQWRERTVYEELCLLYVGMTRAKSQLELFVRTSRKGLGAVAWAGLKASGDSFEVGQRPGDRQKPTETVPHYDAPAWARPEAMSGDKRPEPAPWRLAMLRPSGLNQSTDVGTLLRGDTAEAEVGLAVHRLLEAVEWLEDAGPDPRAWAIEEHGGRGAAPEAASRIEAALREGGLRSVLSHAAVHARWGEAFELQAMRERDVVASISQDAGPALVRGRVDRLVLGSKSGRVERCLIVDFKTGRVDEAAQVQVELYRQAVAAMLGLEPEAVESEVISI